MRLTKQLAEFHKGFWETAGKNEHMQKQKRERRENRVPQSIVYIVIRLMIDQAFKCVEKYSKPVMETKKKHPFIPWSSNSNSSEKERRTGRRQLKEKVCFLVAIKAKKKKELKKRNEIGRGFIDCLACSPSHPHP